MVLTLDPSLSIERILGDTYLESIFGKVHPDNFYENDPYNVNSIFRCRFCESRQSSYFDLRDHLKTCSGVRKLWPNYEQGKCEVAENVTGAYPPEGETKLEISSSKRVTHFSIIDENDNICTATLEEPNSCQPQTSKDHNQHNSTVNKAITGSGSVAKKGKKRRGRKPYKHLLNLPIKPVIKAISRATEMPPQVQPFIKVICTATDSLVPQVIEPVAVSTKSEHTPLKSPEAERLLPGRSAKKSTFLDESILDIILDGAKSSTKNRQRRESAEIKPHEEKEVEMDDGAIESPAEPVISPATTPAGHQGSAGMPCKHCPERLARRFMIHHVRSKHPELLFVCSGCFSGFVSSHDFSQHKKKCSAMNVAKMIRRRSYSRSRSAKRTRSNTKPLTCPLCVEEFMSTAIGRSILVKHVKEQHHAKFVCRWCFYNTDNLQVGKLHKCNGPSLANESTVIGIECKQENGQVTPSSQSSRSPLRIIQVASSSPSSSQYNNVCSSFESKASELKYSNEVLDDNFFIRQFKNRVLDKYTCPFCPFKSSGHAPERFKNHLQIVHPLESTVKQKPQSSEKKRKQSLESALPVVIRASGDVTKKADSAHSEVHSTSAPRNNLSLCFEDQASLSEHSDGSSRRRSSRLCKTDSGDLDVSSHEAVESDGTVGSRVESKDEAVLIDDRVITPQKIDPNGDIIETVFREAFESAKRDPTRKGKASVTPDSAVKSETGRNKSPLTPLRIDTNLKPSRGATKSLGDLSTPHFHLNNELRGIFHGQPKVNLILKKQQIHSSDCKLSSRELRTRTSPHTSSIAASRPQRHSSVLTEKDDPRTTHMTRSQMKSTKYACPFKNCEFVGRSTEIMTHLVRLHDQKYCCHVCFKCFPNNKSLERHYEGAHGEPVPRPKQNRIGAKLAKRGARK